MIRDHEPSRWLTVWSIDNASFRVLLKRPSRLLLSTLIANSNRQAFINHEAVDEISSYGLDDHANLGLTMRDRDDTRVQWSAGRTTRTFSEVLASKSKKSIVDFLESLRIVWDVPRARQENARDVSNCEAAHLIQVEALRVQSRA